MSVITSNQGMIKQSEVALDNAQTLLDTQQNEDCLTVVEQLRRISTDSLRRMGLLLTSRDPGASTPGSISWNSPTIGFVPSTNIIIKLLQNESGSVVDLVLQYGAANTATTFRNISLSNGQILYVELSRANISSGPVIIENACGGGSSVAGKTAKVASSMPVLKSIQGQTSTDVHGTICIPLAICIDSALWWIPHGIYWFNGASSPLGSVITTTSSPKGTIQSYHKLDPSVSDPLGYESMRLQASGFQLCNGSIIIDPLSPYSNPTRDADGTPNGSTNYGLDVFVPNINGPMMTYTNTRAYTAGDYVLSGGIIYVAIQSQSAGGGQVAPGNLSYWRPPSNPGPNYGYNDNVSGNTVNKYRRTTQNDPISGDNRNTYLRGSSQNWRADLITGYNNGNTVVLSDTHIPNHRHAGDDHRHNSGTQFTDRYHRHGADYLGACVFWDAPANEWNIRMQWDYAYSYSGTRLTWYPGRSTECRDQDGEGWGGGSTQFCADVIGYTGYASTYGTYYTIGYQYYVGAEGNTGYWPNLGSTAAHSSEPRSFSVINIIKIY